MSTKKRLKQLAIAAFLLFLILEFSGVKYRLYERDFFAEFDHPMLGDIRPYVDQLEMSDDPGSITPPFASNQARGFTSLLNRDKCFVEPGAEIEEGVSGQKIRLAYVVKSAPGNADRRTAIRKTWGYEKRFADVPIRTVFVVGRVADDEMQRRLAAEFEKFGDLVQADFVDSYYNNTLKTLAGLKWAKTVCGAENARFFVFVDDDYYVSTRNLLRFLRNPVNYPQYLENPTINFDDVREQNQAFGGGRRLQEVREEQTRVPNTGQSLSAETYDGGKRLQEEREQNELSLDGEETFAGQTFAGRRKLQQLVDFDLPEDVLLYAGHVKFPRPQRHWFGKWSVSIEEYPFDKYPPYATAGAYVLSSAALTKFYHASLFVKVYIFDDVYMGMLARKLGVEPFHSAQFWFHRKQPYKVNDFRYTVASHEFPDPAELERVWNQQKQAGNA